MNVVSFDGILQVLQKEVDKMAKLMKDNEGDEEEEEENEVPEEVRLDERKIEWKRTSSESNLHQTAVFYLCQAEQFSIAINLRTIWVPIRIHRRNLSHIYPQSILKKLKVNPLFSFKPGVRRKTLKVEVLNFEIIISLLLTTSLSGIDSELPISFTFQCHVCGYLVQFSISMLTSLGTAPDDV